VNHRELLVALLLVGALAIGAGLATLRRARLVRLATACPVSVAHVAADSGRDGLSAPLDLNSATASQLEALPGIGPVIAQRVVDYRTRIGRFESTSQLRRVSGIGPRRMAALRGLVSVGQTDSVR
jgi:competence protein ComEA